MTAEISPETIFCQSITFFSLVRGIKRSPPLKNNYQNEAHLTKTLYKIHVPMKEWICKMLILFSYTYDFSAFELSITDRNIENTIL